MNAESLGMIEVTGYLGVIAVADTVLKAADVKLLQVEKISGGLTTLQITGDVGAVQAAIQAGEVTARELNCLIASHVIPRVDPSVLLMETSEQHQEKNEEKLNSDKTKLAENRKSATKLK